MTASDKFPQDGESKLDSGAQAFAITPSDSTELSQVTRAIHVGVGGTISCIFKDDSVAVSLTVVGGTCLPYRIRQVKATGTSASGLVGIY